MCINFGDFGPLIMVFCYKCINVLFVGTKFSYLAAIS